MILTDDQIIERWLESQNSDVTREGYAADFERFRQHVGVEKPLGEVEIGDAQRYAKYLRSAKGRGDKPLRPSRQRRLINVVRSFYKFATRLEYLPKNPTVAVRLPKPDTVLAERIMTREEVDRLIAAEEKPRNQLLLRVIFYSGTRVSEVIGMRWRHVKPNKEGGQLSVFGKGGDSRTILIPIEIYQAMLVEKERVEGKEDDYVFPSQKSPQLSRHQIFRIVKQAAKKAGLSHSISTHWLRHANATIAMENGAPLHLIQKTLGHKTILTTEKYLHARPDDSSGLYLDKKK